MSVPRIPSLSTEYVKVGPVRLVENGVLTDPTDSVVEFAFEAGGVEPADLEWVAGSWETGSGRYFARALVGPDGGDVDPGDGTWAVWVRITRNPERIARNVGVLVIT